MDREALKAGFATEKPVDLPYAPEEWGELLNMDDDLQVYCEGLLEGQAGAIVVLNADTGAVLALASAPYAPFRDVLVLERDGPARPVDSPRVRPRYARAYQEQYPPGALFKVVLAATALEERVITPESTFHCGGQFRIDGQGHSWHCWKRDGHGTLDVENALAFNCDVFFYNVGLLLGPDLIQAWAQRMGLGEATGIGLPNEVEGLITGREWKQGVFSDRDTWDQNWFPGDTVNLSIGQGFAAATPLQNAVMMATIVNGGYRVVPQVAGGVSPRGERLFSDVTLETVRAGLRLAVDKAPPDYPAGTAWRAGVDGVGVLGKTGSAQIMSLAHREQYDTEDDIPYAYRDHAWFVAGVLDREPRIAVCVLVEHGHHGSTAAAPLARQVIEYLHRPLEPVAGPPPPIESQSTRSNQSWSYLDERRAYAVQRWVESLELGENREVQVDLKPIPIDPNWRRPANDIDLPETTDEVGSPALDEPTATVPVEDTRDELDVPLEPIHVDPELRRRKVTSENVRERQSGWGDAGRQYRLVHFHSGLTQPADSVADKDPYYLIEYRDRSYRVRKELVRTIEPRGPGVARESERGEEDVAGVATVSSVGAVEEPTD